MTTKAKTPNSTDVPDVAQKVREQLLSTVQQSQDLTVGVVQTWAKAWSALPAGASSLPRVSAAPGLASATGYTVDVLTDLLEAQRSFAVRVADVLAPADEPA